MTQPADWMMEDTSPAREAAIKRSTWVSVLVNLGLCAMQLVVGLVSGSQGLVADGIHSLSDLVSDLVVLLAAHHSGKSADEDHPYGHRRFENAASLVLGLILVCVAAGMLWAAISKLRAPDSILPVQMTALWVALAALVIKESLFRYMLRIATQVRSSLLVANAWHARSDAASSLIVAVGIGGSLMGLPLLDPLASLVVGLFVFKMGSEFALAAINDLTDRGATAEEVAGIEADIRATPGVLGLHGLKTRRTGDLLLVDVHLEVAADMTVAQGHAIALAARQQVLERHAVLNLMTHVDPVERT